MVILAYIADIFKKDIGVLPSLTNVINMQVIGTSLFLIIIIGLFSLLMYFQEKKSNTFLKHRLWDKMYIILPVIFLISFIVFIILFMTDLLNGNRWMIYVLIYYILFLINMTVLAIIHKVKKQTIPNENKIGYSFVWTSLGLLVVIFIL